jgi:hypothetical protein
MVALNRQFCANFENSQKTEHLFQKSEWKLAPREDLCVYKFDFFRVDKTYNWPSFGA